MKKLIAVLLALTMIGCALAGCSSSGKTDATESTPAATEASSAEAAGTTAAPTEAEPEITTITPGVLTVATSPDFAPYECYALGEDNTPTLAGFDMALAQYIADYLGLELEVIPPWTSTAP